MKTVVLALGYHDREAPRHWNIRHSLEEEGYEVRECHTEQRGFLGKYLDLRRQFLKKGGDAAIVLVTFPGHFLMPLAWWLTRKSEKRIVFDAFLSLWDTLVDDRRKFSKWNPYAWFLYFLDLLACHLADEVWIDTQEHRKFFIHTFFLPPEKISVRYIGSRADLFTPGHKKEHIPGGRRNVLFYGTYIPLQGIEHIIAAARILSETHPHVHFTLIGSGQTHASVKKSAETHTLRNVTFIPRVPFAELPHMIRRSDLCLGIFGTGGKSRRVIPHKVYDAVSCGVPTITADTPAIREKFERNPLVILCRAGDPKDLAEKIIRSLP